MNPFGFHALHLGWLAIAALPLVAVYFLKLKRPKLEIPSLVLWQQVLQDQRVNAPFQRFRRNRLLFLQLLALLLLILAAMQPFLRGTQTTDAGREVWLVDISASMGATAEGKSERVLDRVKDALREEISAMGPNDRRSLIVFDSSASERAGMTANARKLEQAVDELGVHDLPSNLLSALRMAEAISKRGALEKVKVFTDGNLPVQVPFDLSFALEMVNLAHDNSVNAGITALSARRAGPESWLILARIEHNHEEAGTLRVRWDDRGSLDDQVLRLQPGEDIQLLRETSGENGRVQLSILPLERDDLATDNHATLHLPDSRDLTVCVDSNLVWFSKAVHSLPDVSVNSVPLDAADLCILGETASPDSVPIAFHVASIPKTLTNVLYAVDTAETIIDWKRDHPLLQHVDLQEVHYDGGIAFLPGKTEHDLEKAGYRALIHGPNGPLLLEETLGAQERYTLLVPPGRSTLPHRLAFPVTVANLVAHTREKLGLSRMEALRTGRIPERLTTANLTYTLKDPTGKTHDGHADANGRISGLSALRAGTYTLSIGSKTLEWDASVLDSRETSLFSANELSFNRIEVEMAHSTQREDKPLWGRLAWLALALLLVEWRFAHRTRRGTVL